MEAGVEAVVKVIEGDGGLDWIRDLRCLEHLDWNDQMAWERDCWYVLNADGEALQEMLGPCIRHRCSFAVLGLDALGEDSVRRLCRTSARRKFRCVVLGGWRLYPVVSAVKEVVAGGCLGALRQVRVRYGGACGWSADVLAAEVACWLSEGADCQVTEEAGTEGLTVDVTGAEGELHGQTDWEGCGRLDSMLGGHARQRHFTERVDVRRMELQVLRCVGGLPGEIPCLVSCHSLAQTREARLQPGEGGDGEEKVSITDNKG